MTIELGSVLIIAAIIWLYAAQCIRDERRQIKRKPEPRIPLGKLKHLIR